MTDQNIQLFVGETQELNFTVQDDDGNDLDLTDPEVENVHFEVATGLARYGETVVDKNGSNFNQNGQVTFTLDAGDTENLTPGIYLYEVWVDFSGTTNYTAEVGKVFVKPRVDR